MAIGIVEIEQDEFMIDVIAKLSGVPFEFLTIEQKRIGREKRYKLIVDRLSHLNKSLNEYLKYLKDAGSEIINNPFIWSRSNKLVEISIFDELHINHPKTFILPSEGVEWDMGNCVKPIEWEKLTKQVHFPVILKPIDSFGWYKVFDVADMDMLRQLYDALSHRNVLLLQEKVRYKDYYRAFYIDKNVLLIKWEPGSHLRGKCIVSDYSDIKHMKKKIEHKTIAFNEKIGADVNVMEWAIDHEDRAVAIEAYNFIPDIESNAIPREYYDWIVDKFAGMIRERYESL